MARFIAYRLLQFPLILAVIYLVTFSLTWVVPGNPFEHNDRKLSEEATRDLRERFHADRPLGFLTYYPARIVLHGDFGPSMANEGWTVNQIISRSLGVSVTLGICALIIALGVGVAIGTLAAVKRGGAFDMISLTVALIGVSVPSFVVASVLLLMALPASNWFQIGSWGRPIDLLLPSIALSLPPMAYIARLTRVSMLDVLGNDYVRTARAKGLKRSHVIWKHCLKNAFLPVLSYLGPAAAVTLTGSFVIEKVFNIPGLGQHFVNSVQNKDQTLILGTVMVYSIFLLVFNLLVDLGYALIDPRVEVSSQG